MRPRVLIGCECSGIVRDAFRAIGCDAWSCDLKPCERDPEFHIIQDIRRAMMMGEWDFIGLHPDCTAMALSGNGTYAKGKPGHRERLAAIEFTKSLWRCATYYSRHAYLENPTSVIWNHLRQADQYIQPWQFGHGETKKTGLALYGLPKLEPTNVVEGREQRVWKMPPGPNRKTERSRTYQGIADAMAAQWGPLLF